MGTIGGAVEVIEEHKGGVLILKIRGRLDAVSTPSVERKVFDQINEGQYYILLEFSGLDYISSAGMRMLLSTAKKLKALSGKLVLCSLTPTVADVLRLSGFDHVLDIAPDRESALQRFGH